MYNLDSLERMFNQSVPVDGTILDASDFARVSNLELPFLNELISEVGHELYDAEGDVFDAQASVVSLINLGLLSRDRIFESRQYA